MASFSFVSVLLKGAKPLAHSKNWQYGQTQNNFLFCQCKWWKNIFHNCQSNTETYHSTYGTKNITVKYKYHIYRTKKSAPTYNLSTAETKKRYGSTWSNAYYSGYYDYRYGKNWRVIYINSTKKLVYVKNLTNVNAKVSLPASSVIQYSGKVFGSGACGIASTVSMVNSEKGASWNKDSAYSGYNLPLRKINANTMQHLARTVDCSYDNSHYILVLN